MRSSFLACVLFFAPAVSAQVTVSELGEAQSYAAGTLDAASGGLDRNAWTGTTAATAERLIGALPTEWAHPLAEQLALSALLSGGVPPEGEANWRDARADWLLRSGHADAVEALRARDPELARNERLRTELQLSTGRLTEACSTADVREEGRSEPFWARVRAVCHLQRGETAAAELTAELAGGGDEVFDGLFRAKILDAPLPGTEPRTPMHRALLGLWDTEPSADDLLPDMARLDIAALRPRMVARMVERGGDATADLYLAAVDTGSAEAVAGFLEHAEERGHSIAASRHLAPAIAHIPAEDAAEHLDVFIRSAVLREDLSALAELFRASGGSDRVALVSDALGGGFQLRPLGESLDARLVGGKGVREAALALALGARLSPDAAEALEGTSIAAPKADSGDLLVLRAVAASGARAETALRAAAVLNAGPDTATTAEAIRALRTAGLERQARQLGAWELAAIP